MKYFIVVIACLLIALSRVNSGCIGNPPVEGINDRTGTGVQFGELRTPFLVPGDFRVLNVNRSITVETWIYLDTRLSRNGIINVFDVEDNTIYGWSLAVDEDRLQFKVGTTDKNNLLADFDIFVSTQTLKIPRNENGSPKPASWHHIAGIYDFDNGEIRTCVDGVCDMIRQQTGEIIYYVEAPYVPQVVIGGSSSRAVEQKIRVTLDRVAIWNEARTTNQIQEAARFTFVHDTTAAGLIGYWQMGLNCDPRNLEQNPPQEAPNSANGADARNWPNARFITDPQDLANQQITWWQNAFCGDGNICGPEECDDGSIFFTGSCLCTCKLATCGDGFVRVGVEECDQGANNSQFGTCLPDCRNSTCGDGFVQAVLGEQCDLGGNNSFNGTCLPNCQNATCGDGFVRAGLEQCDNGVNDNTGDCNPNCQNATCGDGFVRIGVEECDDGNQNNNDACSNACLCNPPAEFTKNVWVQVNETVTVNFFAPCFPVNCSIVRVPETITDGLRQELSCDVSTINIQDQKLTFVPNSPGRYVLNLTDPRNNDKVFGVVMVAVLMGEAIYSEGSCSGADCCNLVKACAVDLKTNNGPQLNSTIAASWNEEDMLCPFPVCAESYEWERRSSSTGLCVRYVDSTTTITHIPYNSLEDCLTDFRRGVEEHCTLPLSKAWRYCKKGVGLY